MPAIVANVILALLFVYSNFALWSSVNGKGLSLLIASYWNPLSVSAMHYHYVDGTFSTVSGLFLYWNTPFWIFWMLPSGQSILYAENESGNKSI